MIQVIESRLVLAFSVAVLLVMFGPSIAAVALLDRTAPLPHGISRTEAINSPVARGESLFVRIHRQKVRSDCHVASSRTAVNEDGIVFDIPDATWQGGPASGEFFEMAYPIPATIPSGSYVLRVDLTYLCPGGLSFKYEQPEVRFRIQG